MTLTPETEYEYWHQALAHRLNGAPAPAIHADSPQSGKYWMREKKNGPRIAVAIWLAWDNGKKTYTQRCAILDGAAKDPETGKPRAIGKHPDAHWTWCADHPVTQAEFSHYANHGHWPDEVAPQTAPDPANGSNNLPTDPFEALKAELDGTIEYAQDFLKSAGPRLKDKTQCNRATNIRDLLRGLNKRANALFEEEKRPWNEGAKAVDAKYSFRKHVETIGLSLKALSEAWMVDEESRIKAAAEAERKKLEDDRRAVADQDIALAMLDGPEEPLPPPAPIKVRSGGSHGSQAGLKSVWKAEITDWGLAVQRYSGSAELRALVQMLADKEAAVHKSPEWHVPGIKTIEQRKATK